MGLQLRVVGPQAARLNGHTCYHFQPDGGRIGRALDNDWVLPDDDRYVSGHHAKISRINGDWTLIDHSANGTFINGAFIAVTPHTPLPLKDGDRIRIGDYQIVVAITADLPVATPTQATDVDRVLSEEFTISSLMQGDDLQAHAQTAHFPYPAQRPWRPEAAELPDDGSLTALETAQILSIREEIPSPPLVRLPDPHAPPVSPEEAAANHLQNAMELVLRSAGLEPKHLGETDPAQVLTTIGQLFREMTLGLNASLRASTDLLETLSDTPPTTFSALGSARSVDETMVRLLGRRPPRASPAVETVREGYADLRHHEQALHKAMREALHSYVSLFAPQTLSEQFDRVLERSALAGNGKQERYWDMYGNLYRLLTQQHDSGLPHSFAEHYHRVYLEVRLNEDSNAMTANRRGIPPKQAAGG